MKKIILYKVLIIALFACNNNKTPYSKNDLGLWDQQTIDFMGKACYSCKYKDLLKHSGLRWIINNDVRSKLLKYIYKNNSNLFLKSDLHIYEMFSFDEGYSCYVWNDNNTLYNYQFMKFNSKEYFLTKEYKKGTENFEYNKGLISNDFLKTKSECFYIDVLHSNWQCYSYLSIENGQINKFNCKWFNLTMPEIFKN